MSSTNDGSRRSREGPKIAARDKCSTTDGEAKGMKVTDFRQMYVTKLQEVRSAEDQLVHALPKIAGMVQNSQLKKALEHHLDETKTQRDRLDGLLRQHRVDAGQHQDASMQAMVREGERGAKAVSDPDCRDAAVIAAAQRVEHYEIATYGTLASWAKQLDLSDDEQTLHAILQQEKHADEKLTGLAKRVINPEAA